MAAFACKTGAKKLFLGAKPPNFRGFAHFSLLTLFPDVKCCLLISILCRSENVDFCSFFDFFAVPLTPKFCGFWGPVHPLMELWSFIADDLIPCRNTHHLSHCWLTSDDWSRFYVSFRPIPTANHVLPKRAQKRGFLGSHAHSFDHVITRPPKGTSLRENTSFVPSNVAKL